MLIDFSVENFLSIKEEVCFSLLASSDKSLDNNLITGEKALKKNSLLRSAVLYGANASGKSNVLKALDNLKFLIVTSSQNIPGQNIRFLPFKLDKKCLSKPSKFNIEGKHTLGSSEILKHAGVKSKHSCPFSANN